MIVFQLSHIYTCMRSVKYLAWTWDRYIVVAVWSEWFNRMYPVSEYIMCEWNMQFEWDMATIACPGRTNIAACHFCWIFLWKLRPTQGSHTRVYEQNWNVSCVMNVLFKEVALSNSVLSWYIYTRKCRYLEFDTGKFVWSYMVCKATYWPHYFCVHSSSSIENWSERAKNHLKVVLKYRKSYRIMGWF